MKINKITKELIKNSDKIVGDGTDIIHDNIVPLKHSFADQLYIRQMEMKKGTMVIGAVHNHKHVWFLLTGHLTISDNKKVQDYQAPCYVVSDAGTQRAIYANKNSIFVNVHKNPSNTENIEELEKEIVSITKKDFNNYINNKI
jgi:quercetin dioxygenase-like cupin family protein